jgi:tyrosyl-tRNA synthetase
VIDILTVLVKAELVPSRSEARRAVEQGGVTVGDAKVTDIKTTYPVADFADGIIVRRGKKAFKKVVIK